MGYYKHTFSTHIVDGKRRNRAKNAAAIQEQAMQFGGQIPPELLNSFNTKWREIAERITQLTMKWLQKSKK